MTDSKAVDAQMGLEKGVTATAAGLSGANMIFESAGMMASLLGVSFEAFLIDDEMNSLIYRTLRGVEVTEETLGFDSICEAVMGDGHFLGGQSTLDAMERDYFYPVLADRDDPTTWEEGGARDMWDRAREKAKALLAEPDPGYVSADLDRDIRARFPIKLEGGPS